MLYASHIFDNSNDKSYKIGNWEKTKKKEIEINSRKKKKNKEDKNLKKEDIVNTNKEEIVKMELNKETDVKSGWWSE